MPSPVRSALGDLGRELGLDLRTPWFDVTERRFGAQGDFVADDTTSIQAALTAANTAGGGTVIVPAGTYLISASLVIYSNTTLVLDPNATIKLKAGSFCNMIHNAAWVAGSGRDSNIAIIGGVWDNTATTTMAAGQARFLCLMQRVDTVTVQDNTWKRNLALDEGRSIVFYACSGFFCSQTTHSTGGVGINVMGLSTGGRIEDVYGFCGDDAVVLNPLDTAVYNNGDAGDISAVDISNVFATGVNNVKLLVSSTNGSAPFYHVKNINIQNVFASSTGSAVFLGGDSASPYMSNGNLYNISCTDIQQLGAGHTVHIVDMGSGTVYDLYLYHIVFNDNSPNKFTIGFDAPARNVLVENCLIADCFWTGTVNTGISPVVLASSASFAVQINDLTIRDTHVNVTSLYAVKMQGTSPVLNSLRFVDSRYNNKDTTGGIVSTSSATTPTLTDVFVENVTADRVNFILGDYSTTTRVYANNIHSTTMTDLILIRAGAVVTLYGLSGLSGTNITALNNSGTLATNEPRVAKATPAYSASITPQTIDGTWQTITVTNATAFTINAPTVPPDSTHSGLLTIEISNTSGGAMGAITWNAAFVLVAGAFTNPATAKKRFIRFEWNGANWIEIARAGADY